MDQSSEWAYRGPIKSTLACERGESSETQMLGKSDNKLLDKLHIYSYM